MNVVKEKGIMKIWGQSILGRGYRKCKDLEVGTGLDVSGTAERCDCGST